MDSIAEYLRESLERGTAMVTVTVILFILYIIVDHFRYKRKLPPGPTIWPVVGTIPYMKGDLQVYNEFADKYGDICHLELGLFGTRPTIVISSIDLAREALLKKKDEFAGRVRTPSLDFYSCNGKDLVFGDFTKTWRYERKIAHNALGKYTSGLQFQELMELNVNIISEVFRKSKNKPIDVYKPTSLISYNIIANLVFGRKYDIDDPEFNMIRNQMDKINELFDGFFLSDLLPIFRFIPTKDFNYFKKVTRNVHRLVANISAEHKKNFDQNDVKDFTDYIIHIDNEMKAAGLEEYKVELTDLHHQLILGDMFLAGTDSSRISITWTLLFIAAHPEIQKRAQKEIDQQFGRDGNITGANRYRIPYCEAVVFESLRLRPPAPVGLPHATTADTSVGGYDIPKGTQVFINLLRIHSNPKEWENPQEFRPERFLDQDGNLAPKPNSYLPFSTGRRQCVGEAFAKSEMHIIIGKLLQRFNFYPPEGEQINLTPKKNLFLFIPKYTILRVEER